jgi:hypothetical protein
MQSLGRHTKNLATKTHNLCCVCSLTLYDINKQDTFSADMIESKVALATANNATTSCSSHTSSSSSNSSKAHSSKASSTALALPQSLDNSVADTDLSVSARFLLVSGQ